MFLKNNFWNFYRGTKSKPQVQGRKLCINCTMSLYNFFGKLNSLPIVRDSKILRCESLNCICLAHFRKFCQQQNNRCWRKTLFETNLLKSANYSGRGELLRFAIKPLRLRARIFVKPIKGSIPRAGKVKKNNFP